MLLVPHSHKIYRITDRSKHDPIHQLRIEALASKDSFME